MIVTCFLKLGTFFINYFGKLDTLINTLAYVGTVVDQNKIGQSVTLTVSQFKDLCSVTEAYVSEITT
jgi:hypothetical protein